ncbi:unnamed protein product, partial [Allacma fusca]
MQFLLRPEMEIKNNYDFCNPKRNAIHDCCDAVINCNNTITSLSG